VPPFSPKHTFPDIQVYRTVEGVIDEHDALIELFESIEQLLNRLDIYTEIPPTVAMAEAEMAVKILVELLA
jgi:hypothetical protein